MVFRRRDPRTMTQTITQLLYPKGGWLRAAHYVKHRVRRLPDSPQKIARGIWAGVFTSFTPLFGLHFLVAASIAYVIRGNILASLMATFFGNPPTFILIAAASMKTGHFILGSEFTEGDASIGDVFGQAFAEIWHNIKAIFTPETAEWSGLYAFFHDVFLPYLVGGIIPGAICATVCYFLSIPVITAYQKRRKKKIMAKFDALKKQAGADQLDLTQSPDTKETGQ